MASDQVGAVTTVNADSTRDDEKAALSTVEDALSLLDDIEGFPSLLVLDDEHDDEQRQHTLELLGARNSMIESDLLQESLVSNGDDSIFTSSFEISEAQTSSDGKRQDVDSHSGTATTTAKNVAEGQTILKKQTNLSRNRIKNELVYLRKQVERLERELNQLKHQFPTSTPSSSSSESASMLETVTFAVPSLWERVAKHQMDEKLKAQAENMKLRGLLEKQLKIARSLEKLLRKRPDPAFMDARGHISTTCKRVRLTKSDEASVYHMLTARLANLYSQVDTVFQETGLASNKTEQSDAQIKMNEADSTFVIELLGAKIFPFGLQQTSEAVWKFLTSTHTALSNGFYSVTDSTKDMLSSQSVLTLRLLRSDAIVRIHIVMRRFTEASRVVVIWATLGETEGPLLRGKQRIRLTDSGWGVIEEVPVPMNHNGSATIIQSCVRLTPELISSSDQQQTHIGLLTDLIIGSVHQNMKILHQAVENIMVVDHMTNRKAVADDST